MNAETREWLSNRLVILAWVIGVFAVWEFGATVIENTKRTPENVLPHLYQIVQSAFSSTQVSSQQTAVQLVMSNAGVTLFRAGIGFALGIFIGVFLALLMRLFTPVEKTAFPYLMMIQMIPILGMAPIVLAITRDINKSRIVIAAILTFYPVATNTLAGLKSVERVVDDRFP